MLILLIILILLLAALLCGVCIYFFNMAIYRGGMYSPPNSEFVDPHEEFRDKVEAGERWFKAAASEDISIQSEDGLTLRGYYIPHDSAARTVIFVHGYHGEALHDFSTVIEDVHQMKCNLLMINQRAHATSEGKYLTYGALESGDVLRWCEYAARRSSAPIFLYGISMGASTVMLASSRVPDTVAGIIADCGFTSAWDMFAYMLKYTFRLPVFPILHLTAQMGRAIAHFDFKTSVTDALRQSRVPVLFFHGGADDFVPTEMSRINYAACTSEKELVIIDGAEHTMSYLRDTQLYRRKLTEFFERYSQKKEPK